MKYCYSRFWNSVTLSCLSQARIKTKMSTRTVEVTDEIILPEENLEQFDVGTSNSILVFILASTNHIN